MRFIWRSWVCWACIVVIGVVWGLPHFPHYHRDLPYIYDLGGTIFVVWYMGFGLVSLGVYGLVMGFLHVGNTRARVRAFLLGGGSLIIFGVVYCVQTVLMNLSVRLG